MYNRESGYQLALFVMCMLLANISVMFQISLIGEEKKKHISRFILYVVTGVLSLVITYGVFSVMFRYDSGEPLCFVCLAGAVLSMLVCGNKLIKADPQKWPIRMFAIYLLAVLIGTFFIRLFFDGTYVIVLNPFLDYQDYIAGHYPWRANHVFLNIMMFVPLGFLLPLMNPKRLMREKFVLVGTLISLSIETMQLLFNAGECDVVDIFMNTVGMQIGMIIAYIYQKYIKPKYVKEKEERLEELHA